MTHDRNRIYITMLTWLHPGGMAAMASFRQNAAPLFAKHDVRVERLIAGTGKGQLVGTNPHETPDLLQIVSMPSLEAFRAYTSDPEYVRLAATRDVGIRRMTALVGSVSPPDPSMPSTSALGSRLYGFAFLRFAPGGEGALAEFNRRAQPLFARHGMHIEAMLEVAQTLSPLGRPLEDFAPERAVVFFLDDPSVLGAYASDPEYLALAPIRDRGLERYAFFLGKVPA